MTTISHETRGGATVRVEYMEDDGWQIECQLPDGPLVLVLLADHCIDTFYWEEDREVGLPAGYEVSVDFDAGQPVTVNRGEGCEDGSLYGMLSPVEVGDLRRAVEDAIPEWYDKQRAEAREELFGRSADDDDGIPF